MSITLPNFMHSFICPDPVPDFLVFHTPRSPNQQQKNKPKLNRSVYKLNLHPILVNCTVLKK